jgi:hypothetical protein
VAARLAEASRPRSSSASNADDARGKGPRHSDPSRPASRVFVPRCCRCRLISPSQT